MIGLVAGAMRLPARAVLAALIATEVLALSSLPFVPWRVLGTLIAFAAPFALLAAAGLAVLDPGAQPGARRPGRTGGHAHWEAHDQLAATAAVMVAWAGMYVASCLTIWGPFDPATYAIEAAGIAAAAGAFKFLRRSRHLREAARLAGVGRAAGAAILPGVMGLLVLADDVFVFPSGYFLLHEALWAAGGALLVIAAWMALRAAAARSLLLIGLIAVALLVPLRCVSSPTVTSARFLALHSLISHRAFVQTVWHLADRDGDGFTARLGGTDCDDGDPSAYPLSRHGRDCTGVRGSPRTKVTGASTEHLPSTDDLDAGSERTMCTRIPAVVVVLTIDAFRCGFGTGEAPDLRDICPELTGLGHQGHLRMDGHTTATQTQWAIGSLLTGRETPTGAMDGPAPALPRAMSRLGFTTHGIPTCTYAAIAPGADQFDELDTSLIAGARSGAAISGRAVNNAILARVAAARAPGGRPLFLWAHYMDPHAPYLQDASTRIVTSPRHNYAAEIRRTDALIGDLARALESRSTEVGDVLLFVTADHGEELGEHGLAFHGAQVFEESARIPMLAWSSGGDHRHGLPPELPASLGEVKRYVEAAVRCVSFVPSSMALSWAPLTGAVSIVHENHKLIYHPHLGLFESFDLQRDPGESAGLVSSNLVGEPVAGWAVELGRELVARAVWLPDGAPARQARTPVPR